MYVDTYNKLYHFLTLNVASYYNNIAWYTLTPTHFSNLPVPFKKVIRKEEQNLKKTKPSSNHVFSTKL